LILLDTHVWIWFLNGDSQLPNDKRTLLEGHPKAVSAISCWEVAKLVDRTRLKLTISADEWIARALGRSGISVLPLEPEIAVLSIELPGSFHEDPADF
jgi:PIN domain nuclease of toxin-antitoxin system